MLSWRNRESIENQFLTNGGGTRKIAPWKLRDGIIQTKDSRCTSLLQAAWNNAPSDKMKNSTFALRATITFLTRSCCSTNPTNKKKDEICYTAILLRLVRPPRVGHGWYRAFFITTRQWKKFQFEPSRSVIFANRDHGDLHHPTLVTSRERHLPDIAGHKVARNIPARGRWCIKRRPHRSPTSANCKLLMFTIMTYERHVIRTNLASTPRAPKLHSIRA